MDGENVDEFKERAKHKFGLIYAADWMVWAPAQVRFRFLTEHTLLTSQDLSTRESKSHHFMNSFYQKYFFKWSCDAY